MLKNKKIIAMLLLLITLFSNCSNLVYAVEINSANLTTIHDSDSQIQFKYDSGWTNVRTNYIGYYANGTVYPAYCISHGLPGVDEMGDYTVSIERVLDDVQIWRTIINGFPYKSASQLGVECDLDAYVATKQAIYCIILGRDVRSLYRGRNARGDKIVNAMANMVNEGRYGTTTPQSGAISAVKSGSFYEEGNYYVQKYNVSSAVQIGSYYITSTANLPSGTIITNGNGTQTTNFNGGESFFVKVPKSSLNTNINAVINIQGKCKTYPVFFGQTPNSAWQNYAVTYDPYGDGVGRTTLDIATNTGKIKVTKIDSENSKPIQGVKFQLLKEDGTQVATATTDSNGVATFSNLYQAKYKLREISTLNTYILNSQVFDISVEYNKTATKTVTNVHKKGHIKINKTDSETSEPVQDVTFQLIDSNGTVVQTGTTNIKGELYFNDIRVGNYKLKEVKTNVNYVLNTTVFDVKVEHEKTTVKDITNDYKKGNLKINKTDAETSQGIEGVVFELQKKDGTVVQTGTTNKNGELAFNNIRIGDYILKEVSTNPKYILNTNTFDVKIEYTKTTIKDITNEHKRGNVLVSKVDKDNNKIALGNVIFDLYSYEFNKVIGTYTTDVNGEFRIDNLRIGKYSLIEKNTGKWYNLAEDTEVNIEWNKTIKSVVENELKKGKVRVIKVDMDNNEVKIPNVVFEVKDSNGKVLEKIKTNENGIAETSKFAIRDYDKLILQEIETDKWYVLNDKEVKIELKENDIVEIQFENELKKGQIRVIKVDMDNNEVKLKGVEFKVFDESGNVVDTLITDENGEAVSKRLPINQNYKVQESKTLENYVLNEEVKTVTLKQDQITDITFENELKKGKVRVIKVDLYNNEVRLEGVEFNLLDEEGNVIEKLITDKNGEAVSKEYRIDKEYKLIETKTLEKYDLNEEVKTVTLKQDQITDITFENELKKGQIRVIKVDMDNNEVKLKGVEFKVFDESGNVVDTLITDENGEAVSKELRVNQNYKVQESKTLEDYVLNEEVKTVTLKPAEITDITFENEKIKGYIQITKTSLDENKCLEVPEGTPIKDVVFEIYNTDGEIEDTITTNEKGIAITKELLKGKYTIKEIVSGKYFLLNEEIFNAEIVKDQEVVNVNITNESVKIEVNIEKYGFKETQSKDNIYYNFKNIKNNSNVTLDNFTWQDLLPTNAVRINKIYTGTWNEELEYSVWYKTNKNDYRMIEEKISTQEVKEIDFTKLKLQEEEYVTEYEFRFGTVKAGFSEVESPVLYCDMLDGLGNGFVFTNNTKVSGTYLEKYVEDIDKWTTITYFKEINKLEKLPRTGF